MKRSNVARIELVHSSGHVTHIVTCNVMAWLDKYGYAFIQDAYGIIVEVKYHESY